MFLTFHPSGSAYSCHDTKPTGVRPSWASGPAAAEMCALLISTKGIEDINVGTYPGGEVAVHVHSSRTSNRKELTVLSTCSSPARPWWAKLELLRGPVHMSARLAQATSQPRRALPVCARATLESGPFGPGMLSSDSERS